MNKITVENRSMIVPAAITVCLTPAQAADRMHCLEQIFDDKDKPVKGTFILLKAIQFKQGEKFSCNGQITKAGTIKVTKESIARRAPDSKKAASKAKKSKDKEDKKGGMEPPKSPAKVEDPETIKDETKAAKVQPETKADDITK